MSSNMHGTLVSRGAALFLFQCVDGGLLGEAGRAGLGREGWRRNTGRVERPGQQ